MSNYNNNIIMGDVLDSIRTVGLSHDPLNTDLNVLAREFLNYFIEENCIILDFIVLREKYIERFDARDSGFFNVPENEDEFYEEICKTYFSIVPNDSSNLEEKVNMIIKDLNTIEQDKSNYIKQLEELKDKEFEEGKNYKEKLLIHYIKKQKAAEEQILSFIKKKLSSATSKNKYQSISSFHFNSFDTYHYNFAPHTYKLEYLSEIRNKLRDVILGRYFELEKLYRTDKNKFLVELKKDFNLQQAIDSIKESVKRNKRLSQRKELLDDILDLIKNGKEQLFCNVVPQQIEGILFDYCLEYGIKENSLTNSTLGDKINLLTENGNTEIDYEYFAFIFPLIRNKVAHGKLIQQDLDLNSWLLLLDLKYACDLLLSGDLQSNNDIYFINELNETTSIIELLKIAPIINSGIDDFYNDTKLKLDEEKERIRSILIEESFPYDLITPENKENVLENLRKLKRIGINDQECKKIIDKICA